MKSSTVISLKGVGKTYLLGDGSIFTALKEIDVDINEGDYVALVGPSGSGKSTLMHVIGLLDKPSSGSVMINGKDISKLNDDDTSTLRSEFVGFVFQQFNLINKLTIKENIMLERNWILIQVRELTTLWKDLESCPKKILFQTRFLVDNNKE